MDHVIETERLPMDYVELELKIIAEYLSRPVQDQTDGYMNFLLPDGSVGNEK